MLIKRIQEENLVVELTAAKTKVLVLYGARQTGKTTCNFDCNSSSSEKTCC